jgi:hypothetical protein
MNFYSIEEYEFQVRELEEEGLCRSDAQAVVDAREMRDAREYAEFRREEDRVDAYDELERDHDEPYEPEPDAYLDASYEDQYDLGDY